MVLSFGVRAVRLWCYELITSRPKVQPELCSEEAVKSGTLYVDFANHKTQEESIINNSLLIQVEE